MAWRDERRGVQLRLPLQPAIAPSGRDRERRGPPVSVRCRERCDSAVGHRSRLQGPESAGSTKVGTCAVFARLPPSDFPPRQPPQSSEDVVIPFPLPCLGSIDVSLTKYSPTALPMPALTI